MLFHSCMGDGFRKLYAQSSRGYTQAVTPLNSHLFSRKCLLLERPHGGDDEPCYFLVGLLGFPFPHGRDHFILKERATQEADIEFLVPPFGGPGGPFREAWTSP